MSWHIRKEIIEKKIGDNLIVINEKTKKILEINKSGSYLWQLLKKNVPKNKLISSLSQKYKIPREKASKDIDDFLKKLKKFRLAEE